MAETSSLRGQPQRGEEAARIALNIDPDYNLSKLALIDALIEEDKLDEAQELLARNYFGEARHFSMIFGGLIAANAAGTSKPNPSACGPRRRQGLGPYHHVTYGLAQIYAMGGKKEQAVRWLRTTAEEGMPCYPMFRDDPLLKNLRGDAGYDRLLEEMRRDWERRGSEG